MRLFLSVAVAIAIFSVACARAAEDAPVLVKLSTTDIALEASGLYTRTQHFEMQAKNEAAAKQIGQATLYFSEALEELEIVEAYTQKADGQKLDVDPAAIFAQHPQGSPQVPSFDDLRQKIIVFPNVMGGDTIVYTARWRAKAAIIPGHYYSSSYFPRSIAYGEVRHTIIAPKNFPLRVETHDIQFEKKDIGDSTSYAWRYSAPMPAQEEPHPVSPLDHMPRFLVSSFRDHDHFARTYAAITESKEIVTPEIQALADQVTNGAADRRQQTQKIYEWVSKNIRYVAVDIGNGGIVPHAAAEIVKNGYGDCKDHNVLFATLLKAKGIASETVLINLGNAYSLPDVAAISPFNHAITWLPEFSLYADTTSGVAPFGILPFEEYGKPVAHAAAAGRVLRRTPLLAAGVADMAVKTTLRVDRRGMVTGDSTMTAAGPYSVSLRGIAERIEGLGSERAAAGVLERQGLAGTGSFEFAPPTTLQPEYKLSTKFSYGPKSEWLAGQQFHLPRGILPSDQPGDFLMGPLFDETLKETEPTACFSGHSVEEIVFEPAAGLQLRSAPPDVNIKTPHVVFTARWTATDTGLSVRRAFASNVDQPLCTGALRREAAKALAEIREHYLYTLAFLNQPQTTVSAAQGKLTDAAAARREGNRDEAIRLYTSALAEPDITPAQRTNAFLNRGFAYVDKRDYPRAIGDLSQSIRLGEASYWAYLNRGFAYFQLDRNDKAVADYSEAIRLNSQVEEPHRRRAFAYLEQGLWEKVIADCTPAIRLDPDKTPCHRIRGYSYYIMGEYQKALADLDLAVRANARDSDAFYNRGLTYLALGQYRQAVVDFDEGIRLTPNAYRTLFARSVAKRKSGDEMGAETDRAAAFNLKQDVAFEMAGLGVTDEHFVKGVDDVAACKTADRFEYMQGLIYCTHTLAASNLTAKDKAAAHSMLGRIYLSGGQIEEAAAALETAIGLDPTDAMSFVGRAMVHADRREHDLALADYETAIRLAPGEPRILTNRAHYFADNGELERAEADLDAALKLQPDAIPVYLARAAINERAGRFDRALLDWDRLVRMAPDRPESFGMRCYVLTLADKLRDAQEDCEKSLALASENVPGLVSQGFLHLKLGQDQDAETVFNKALRVNSRVVGAYYGRGLAKLKRGDATGNDDIADATSLEPDFVNFVRRHGFRP